jgi:AraC-like DNA-binding protein
MYTTEANIPVYSLEELGFHGSKDFEIAECQGLTCQQRQFFFVPHRNNFYKLILVKQGDSRHWVDMVPYTVKPNAFYFSSPHQVILKEDTPGNDVVSICFTEEFLRINENSMLRQLPIIQNLYGGHELLLSDADMDFINDIVQKLLAEYNHEGGWRNSMLFAYLQVLLIYLSRLYTEQFSNDTASPNRELLKKFNVLILENFTRYHDVASYAGMVNLSAGHFSEIIKEQSGKTAIQHIHDRLLLEAKRMLFHTDNSVKEIAYQLGFEDASYFNRFFKRLTLATPSVYREDIRKKYH